MSSSLGGPDRQEAERIEEGQEAEPLDEEREGLPVPDKPQTPEDPSTPEGPKSPEDSEHDMSGREEAEERDLAPGRGFDRPSRESPRRRGGGLIQAPVPEVRSRRQGTQPGRPGPAVHSQLVARLIRPGMNARAVRLPWQEDPIAQAPNSYQEKEAKSAGSGSRRRGSGEEPLEDRREEEELQITHHAGREPEGADPVALSDGSEKDAPAGRPKKRKTPRVRSPLAMERGGGLPEGTQREGRGLQEGGPARGGISGQRVTTQARRNPRQQWRRSLGGASTSGRQDAPPGRPDGKPLGIRPWRDQTPPVRGRQDQGTRWFQKDPSQGGANGSESRARRTKDQNLSIGASASG